MKTWKRALTLLLVLTMLVGMFTFAAGAAGSSDTYTLRLVDNVSSFGGRDSDDEITGLEKGDMVTIPTVTFSMQGYTLIGWSVSPTSSTNYNFSLTSTEKWDVNRYFDSETDTMTLYGVWAKDTPTPVKPDKPDCKDSFYVYVDKNRGCSNDIDRYVLKEGESLKLDEPTRRGYDFVGWYIGSKEYKGTALYESCTITAKWKAHEEKDSFYVYVDYNRNRSNDVDRYVLKEGESLKLDEPTRKGYDFVGWYIGRKEYKGTALYESCTITAKWKEHDDKCHNCSNHKHKIIYTDGVKNEVVFEDVVKYAYHNEKTPTIKDPSRSGYRFAGWSPSVSKYATECVTYTAQWVPVSCYTPSLITSDHVAYLKGYGGGLIKPEATITRAEVATILYRLMDSASVKYYYTTSNSFVDVSRGDWYNEAVSTLANAGVITGYGAGKFCPNAPITRAELVVMLARFTDCNYSGKCRFVDVPSNYWAYDEIALAQEEGWIKGYGAGYFYPGENITRAEVAAILNRMLDRDDCTLKDTKHYADNPVNAWYYEDILEASIAH